MTEETKEIICECGHSIDAHDETEFGCLANDEKNGGRICQCYIDKKDVALASERSARILAEGRVVKLEQQARGLAEVLQRIAMELKFQHQDHKDCKIGECLSKTLISNAKELIYEFENS